jgi:predicted transcriptional regulator
MKEAILEYVKREEASQNFIAAAESSFEHYKQTGLHITLEEFNVWVEQVQANPDVPMPACHT